MSDGNRDQHLPRDKCHAVRRGSGFAAQSTRANRKMLVSNRLHDGVTTQVSTVTTSTRALTSSALNT